MGLVLLISTEQMIEKDDISILAAYAQCNSSACKTLPVKRCRRQQQIGSRSLMRVYETTKHASSAAVGGDNERLAYFPCSTLKALCKQKRAHEIRCVHVSSVSHTGGAVTTRFRLHTRNKGTKMKGQLSHPVTQLGCLMRSLKNARNDETVARRVRESIMDQFHLCRDMADVVHTVGVVLGCATRRFTGSRGKAPLRAMVDNHARYTAMYPKAHVRCFTVLVPCYAVLCTRQVGAVVALARKYANDIFLSMSAKRDGIATCKVDFVDFGIATEERNPETRVAAYAKIVVRLYNDKMDTD